jgi:nucleoside-diphosphate-sugar epimerase
MPPVLGETTEMHPTTRKGGMRVEIEQRIREACSGGMRAVVLRAGDFFGGGNGSWFDLVIAKNMERQRLTYPGPLDVMHAWAYLPDFAATLVRIAERREAFNAFEEFGFPGHAATGTEFIASIEAVTRSKFNVRPMSWWMIKTVGQFMKMGRELAELEYLWRVPHRISGDKLRAAIGEMPQTTLNQAIAESLRTLGHRV